jgi:prefoldin subunit 5
MSDNSEYSEVSQLRTRCTILESQLQVLQKQNAELKATITILHPDTISSKDKNMKNWKDVDKIGKFPVDYSTLGPDDGSFQV